MVSALQPQPSQRPSNVTHATHPFTSIAKFPLAITYKLLLEQPCNPTMISIAIKIEYDVQFFKSGRAGGGLDVLSLIFCGIIYRRNFNVMDSMWSDGRFHKRSDVKERRVERSGGPIMRCRDCRLVRGRESESG